MPHTIEPATSGRAKCRACGEKIASGDLRFGERLPNPFAEGESEMTHWFHPWCAAFRRPEAFLEVLESPAAAGLADRDRMMEEVRLGTTFRRVPRVSTAERASTGRATCRACKTPIAKDTWRIALVFYEDGRFAPSGFVHIACAAAYFETTAIMPRVTRFSPALGQDELAEIEQQVGNG